MAELMEPGAARQSVAQWMTRYTAHIEGCGQCRSSSCSGEQCATGIGLLDAVDAWREAAAGEATWAGPGGGWGG